MKASATPGARHRSSEFPWVLGQLLLPPLGELFLVRERHRVVHAFHVGRRHQPQFVLIPLRLGLVIGAQPANASNAPTSNAGPNPRSTVFTDFALLLQSRGMNFRRACDDDVAGDSMATIRRAASLSRENRGIHPRIARHGDGTSRLVVANREVRTTQTAIRARPECQTALTHHAHPSPDPRRRPEAAGPPAPIAKTAPIRDFTSVGATRSRNTHSESPPGRGQNSVASLIENGFRESNSAPTDCQEKTGAAGLIQSFTATRGRRMNADAHRKATSRRINEDFNS